MNRETVDTLRLFGDGPITVIVGAAIDVVIFEAQGVVNPEAARDIKEAWDRAVQGTTLEHAKCVVLGGMRMRWEPREPV